MKIQFQKQRCHLENVNARSELHGEDRQPAGDLKFTAILQNDVLAAFHPQLKAMLFHVDQSRAADLAEQGKQGDPNHLPHIKMPNLGSPLKWTDEMTGGKLTIHYGLGGKDSDIVLNDIRVNEFRITPQDHGLVELGFRVQAHPDEKQFGKLCGGMIQTDVEISIEPPDAPAEPAL